MALTGQGLVDFCKSKVGTPYFYGSKMEILTKDFMNLMHRMYPSTVTESYMQKAMQKGMIGRVCVDCSGLIGAYRHKQIGTSQMFQDAFIKAPISDWQNFVNGAVLYREGHVGVLSIEDGKRYVYESKGIDYGVVKSDFNPSKWTHGLCFADIDYFGQEQVIAPQQPVCTGNPFPEPERLIQKGCKGEDVKWVQYELNECGAGLVIDGDCGEKTDAAIRFFQASCKIVVDGIVGNTTKGYLKGENVNPYPAPTRLIKFGCEGEDVKWVQFELNQAGYNLEVDGICGSKTDAAIRGFQSKYRLLVDGVVGNNTKGELIRR